MPGDEVGDGVHNFFGQENLSGGQQHPQANDGNWQGLGNTSWIGNQGHVNGSFNPNFHGFNVQQSDRQMEHGAPSSNMSHCQNFMQSSVRPEFARSVSESQLQDPVGYIHGHQLFQTKHYESNLGVESDRRNLIQKDIPKSATHLGASLDAYNKNLMALEANHSQENHNLFRGQQYMSGIHPGLLHSQSRQQLSMGDMQFLQQQAMLKRLQEQQRRQQVQKQQQDQRVPHSFNQASAPVNQATGNPSTALINGIPVHGASNYSSQSETMAFNSNWLQQGISPAMQGSAAGQLISPQHSQALHLMGVVPERVDQSFYGIPISSTGGNSSPYSHTQIGRTSFQQVSACENSFPCNQSSSSADQMSEPGAALRSRELYQGRKMRGDTANQILDRGNKFDGLHQATEQGITNMHNADVPGRLDHARLSEKSHEKTSTQVAPSQNVSTLDPIEEKILFGSDDNVWNVFGRSDGTDSEFACMSSGTWGALMQSAVAETSSNDTGINEEWSGLSFINTEQTENQHALYVNDGVKHPPTQHFPIGASIPISLTEIGVGTSCHNISRNQASGMNNRLNHGGRSLMVANSPQRSVEQYSSDGNKWLGQSLFQQSLPQGSNIYGTVSSVSGAESNGKSMFASWIQQQNSPSNRHNGWNLTNSVSPSGEAISNIHGSETNIQGKMAKDINAPMVKHAESIVGCPQIYCEDNNNNTFPSTPNSSYMRATSENSQELLHPNRLGFSKQVDLSVRSKEDAMPGDFQPNMGSNTQNFASSGKDSPSHWVEQNEAESDSLRSNASHHVSTSTRIRENALSDAGNSQTFPGSKENTINQVGQRPPGTLKFQYHPMEDVDIDQVPLYGSKNTVQSQSIHLPVSRRLMGPDQEQPKVSSQNMLELLHKVDQYDCGPARNLNSPRPWPSSGFVNADGTFGQSQKIQSVPRSFGLQLAPPSQQQLNKDQAPSHQSSAGLVNSHNSKYMLSDGSLQTGNKALLWNIQGNSSDTSNMLPQLGSCNEDASQSNSAKSIAGDSAQERHTFEGAQVSELSAITGITQKGPVENLSPHFQYPILGQQCLAGSQTADSHNSSPRPTSLKRTLSGLQRPDEPITHIGVDGSFESAPHSFQGIQDAQQVKGSTQQHKSIESESAQGRASASQVGPSVVNHSPDACPSYLGRTQDDIEAMSHTLRPEKMSQNLSLLRQMQVRNDDMDLLNRNAKRFKGLDGKPDFQPVVTMKSQLSNQEIQSTSASAKDMLQFGLTNLQKFPNNFNPAYIRGDRQQISPQMAPSWFGQYGTLQNGPTLPNYGAQSAIALKSMEQPPVPGRAPEDSLACNTLEKESSTVNDSKLGNIHQTSSLTIEPSEPISSPQLLLPEVTAQSLAVGLKKSKSYKTELLPWFKEVIMGSFRLPNISITEVEWARATNRLIEKVEDEVHLIFNGPPRARSKSRLTLTTQFMQQLLRPPLASMLSVDAITSYENVVYFVARLALGDACRSISCSGKMFHLSHDSKNLSFEKAAEVRSIHEPEFFKVAKDFLDRAKKLEDDLLRLEKGVSILDLRLECQDLEKISVINRFAKFHSRGQAEGTDALPSSDLSANLQKLCPQRYVTALQMPRNIPDRVQCLSL